MPTSAKRAYLQPHAHHTHNPHPPQAPVNKATRMQQSPKTHPCPPRKINSTRSSTKPSPATGTNAQDPPPPITSPTTESTPATGVETAATSVKTPTSAPTLDTRQAERWSEAHEETKNAPTIVCQDPPANVEIDHPVVTEAANKLDQVSFMHRKAGGQHQLRAQ